MELKAINDNAEAMLLIAELQVNLAEAKVQVAEMIEENQRLREELKQATSATPELVIKDGRYGKPDGDGPFCTTCYDTEKKLVRLGQTPSFAWVDFGPWRCGHCDNHSGGVGKKQGRISFGTFED